MTTSGVFRRAPSKQSTDRTAVNPPFREHRDFAASGPQVPSLPFCRACAVCLSLKPWFRHPPADGLRTRRRLPPCDRVDDTACLRLCAPCLPTQLCRAGKHGPASENIAQDMGSRPQGAQCQRLLQAAAGWLLSSRPGSV